MKKSVMHLVLGSVLAFSMAGCGKDKDGGSSAPAPKQTSTTSSVSTSGADKNSVNAFNNFKKWYSSTNEGHIPGGPGLYTEVRKITTYGSNSSSNCTEKPIEIFGINLGTATVCGFNSGPSNSQEVEKQVAVLYGGKKSTNKVLADIYGGKFGKLIWAMETRSMYGQLFLMRFQKSDGSVREFWVDAGVNSAFQPVKKIDLQAKKEEVLYQIH